MAGSFAIVRFRKEPPRAGAQQRDASETIHYIADGYVSLPVIKRLYIPNAYQLG
jgi:hypothetical protein